MSNETIGKKIDAKKLTLLAMFVALSYLCVFFFRFKVQFLPLLHCAERLRSI